MALLNLCVWACAEPVGALTPNECVIRTAESYLGVKETARNSGPVVDKIIIRAGGKPGQPWCAWFARYIHLLCGISRTGQGMAASWFTRERLISPTDVVRGDVASVWNRYLGRIGHILFIRTWDRNSQFLTSVEGNTNSRGSREGSGVRSLQRAKKDCFNYARWWATPALKK